MEKAAVRRNYGMAAEEAAALFLEGKGIRILERNFRSYHGEIDIIALEKETILIVEVKMRRNKECGTPAEAVNLKKTKKNLLYIKLLSYEKTAYGHNCCSI